MTSLAPDLFEPVVAWRVWTVEWCGDRAELRSIVQSTPWEPARPLQARCLRPHVLRPFRRHAAPARSCRCGIYGAELSMVAPYLDAFGLTLAGGIHRIIGQVSLWGDVVECERGFRAMFAYPHRLYLARRDAYGQDRADVDALADALSAFRVPVVVTDVDDARLPQAIRAIA